MRPVAIPAVMFSLVSSCAGEAVARTSFAETQFGFRIVSFRCLPLGPRCSQMCLDEAFCATRLKAV